MIRPRLSDLWTLQGTITRGPYTILGLILFALKYNLDRIVASSVFHRTWSLFQYFAPRQSGRVDHLTGDDLRFFGTLLLLAIPFIYSGVALTLRRLRSAGLPQPLVFLFFLPLLNLLFFALLCVIPPREGPGDRAPALLLRVLPRSKLGSAAMALVLVLPVAALLTVFSVHALQSYGWGLFVGLPFSIGLAAALLYGAHEPRGLGACLSVAVAAITLFGGILLIVAIEGVFCLIMAWPLGAGLGALGGLVGYLIQRREPAPPRGVLVVLLCGLPALMGAESAVGGEASLLPVRTSVEIAAPPAAVWRHVVTFSELPPPSELLFRAGIAYPQHAEISGQGVGAVRRCVFSTGPFVEPITVWDEPRLLRFTVTAQPPAMKETTPYGHIDAPHISNFLVSEGGQFELTELPGGRTRLTGTTWYRHRIWPADYWRVWSDWILHSIHLRVLHHIQHETESEQRAG